MAITWTEGLEPEELTTFRSLPESARRSINYLQGLIGYANPLETNITFLTGIYSIYLVAGGSGYLNPPTVSIGAHGSSGGSGATATATISSGVVNALTLTANGSGYLKIPTGASSTLSPPGVSMTGVDVRFTFTDEDCNMATNVITKTAHGMSDDDRIHLTTTHRLPYGLYDTDDIGNIYVNPDFYVINATTDTFQLSKTSGGTAVDIRTRKASGTTVISTNVAEGEPTSNYVVGVNITDGGQSYASAPTITFSSAPEGGTTATGTVVMEGGIVDRIDMVEFGSGYVEEPSVTFTGGYGTHSVRNGGGATVGTTIGHGATAKPITSDTGVVTGITMLTSGGGTGATATASNVGDSVASSSGLSGGSGYSSAPTISFTGGDGTGAAATATESGGAVTGITITAGGSGYTSAPTIAFSGGGGTGASATAVLEVHPYITSVAITAGGSGYETAPTVTFSSPGSGTTATGTAIGSNGAITGITITNAGSGYSTLPTVIFFGGGRYINTTVDIRSGGNSTQTGIGATATCTLEAAAVKTSTVTAGGTGYASLRSLTDKATAVSTAPISTDKAVAVSESSTISGWLVDNGGSGYSSAPTVTFSGGGGSGATGTASVSGGSVTSVSISSGGSGYSSAPSISYSGGGGSGAGGSVILSGSTVSSVKLGNLPAAWEGAGYTLADATSVKTVVDAFITKCTEAENAIVSLLAQISSSSVGNFLEHNEMLCGLQEGRVIPTRKKAFGEIMNDIHQIEGAKHAAGVPYVNYNLKLMSTLYYGDDTINTCMAHLYINPLSAGTYNSLNIVAGMLAASSNATTLIATINSVKAPLDTWVSNVSGDVGAFNTLRTNDEAELATVEAFMDYWQKGQVHNGFWPTDYTKLVYTDVMSSRTTGQIMDFRDANEIEES
jgi:hypothetical protein